MKASRTSHQPDSVYSRIASHGPAEEESDFKTAVPFGVLPLQLPPIVKLCGFCDLMFVFKIDDDRRTK